MKKDDCFFDEETSNATTIVSSGTATSPTPPTNSSGTGVPQYQEKPGQKSTFFGAEPL